MFSLLIVIIYASFISLGLPDALLGSAWPSIYQDFHVPISYAGIISMIISGCTILSSLFCSRFVRKYGTGKITALSVAMTAVALFGFSVTKSFPLLCLWAVPYGLGGGSVDAALNNFVALHYKAKHMNWLHSFWGVGATIGPYIMAACLANRLGWNTGYRIVSFIQIGLTVILISTLPLWKQAGSEADTGKRQEQVLGIKHLLALPYAKQILVAFFCYCSLELVTGLWGSSYMVIKKGFSSELAASMISIFYLGITVGRFFSGFLTIKLDNRNMIRLGQGIAFLGIFILLFARGQVLVGLGFLLIGLGCAPIYPCLLHQTPERFGKEVSQSMMGLQMATAYIGSTISPFLAGIVLDQVNTGLYTILLALVSIIMIISVELCNRSQKTGGINN
jgi:fucose permease